MENKRTCPECKTIFAPTRSDQKFCDTTCRWNAWRKNQNHKKGTKKEVEKSETNLLGIETPETISLPEKKDLFSSLRGVPETKIRERKPEQAQAVITQAKANEPKIAEPTGETKEIKNVPAETKEYQEAIAEKQRVDTFGVRVLSDLKTSDLEISKAKLEIAQLMKTINTNQRLSRFRNWTMDAEDLFGDEIMEEKMENNFRLQQLNKTVADFETKRKKLFEELNKANKEMNDVMNRLKTIERYEKPKPVPEEIKPPLGELLRGLRGKKEREENSLITENLRFGLTRIKNFAPEPIQEKTNEPEETNVYENENTFEEEADTNNDKLVSSRELRNRQYNSFPFTGKWKDFFGLPSYTFHLAVHGKPGEGKSTFCVQFADYLAKRFGKVVYISGEEGLSKTVQDKIINNNIDNPYLIFADIKSFDEIKIEIPNEYHFIFIDSLDTLRIDAARLKELKEFYPQSAFITISQSTKDGKMRGSQEIVHDTDITAKVENGIAFTTKNRFNARGTEFKVFDNFEKNKTKLNEPKRMM